MSRHAYYSEHQSSITEDHSFIERMLDVETERLFIADIAMGIIANYSAYSTSACAFPFSR
jgi:hypothetical protein